MKSKTKITITVVALSILCSIMFAEGVKADTSGYWYPVYPPDYGSPTFTMVVKHNGVEIGSTSTSPSESTATYVQDTLWLEVGETVTAEFYDCDNQLITTQTIATGAGYLSGTWTAHFNFDQNLETIDDGATYTFSWTAHVSGTYVSGVSFTQWFQLTVTGGDSSTSGYNNGAFYQSGTSTTSTTNYVYSASGSQRSNVYRWQLDSGSWTNVARSNTGTISTTSITMNAAHTVNWGSIAQYPLSYTGGNTVSYGGTASQTSDAWYDSGSQPTVSSNGIWGRSSGSGTRVASWNINSGSNTNVATTGTVTVPLTMDGAKTVNFNSATQKQLTYTGGNSVTLSNPTISGDTGWYDSTATASITSDWIWGASSTTRTALKNCQFDGTNQDPARQNTGTYTLSGILMSATHSVTYVSATQNKLTVTGGNTITYGTASPTSDTWYDSTQSTTVSSNGIYERALGSGKRVSYWKLDNNPNTNVATTGTVTTDSISMSATHDMQFGETTQKQITLDSNTATALVSISGPTISGDNYWYDSGTFITLTVNGIWGRTATTGNRFTGYQISGGGNNPVATTGTYSILSAYPISTSLSFTSTVVTQYKLTVSNGYSTTYSVQPSITGDTGWYDSGIELTVSSNWISPENSGNRTAITNYQIDGANQNPSRAYTGTLTTAPVTMNSQHTIAFTTIQQHYFTVTTPYSEATSSANKWYDSMTTVYAGLTSGSYLNNVFVNWSGDALGTNYTQSLPITMDNSKSVLALWEEILNYTFSFTGSAVNVGETTTINITATRGGMAYTEYVINITKDGVLFRPNFSGTYFTDSEPNQMSHTYTVAGLYDNITSATQTFTVTPLTVTWQAMSSGGGAGGGGGGIGVNPTPTSSPMAVNPPTNPTARPVQTPPMDAGTAIAITLVVIIVGGILVAANTGNKKRSTRSGDGIGGKSTKGGGSTSGKSTKNDWNL